MIRLKSILVFLTIAMLFVMATPLVLILTVLSLGKLNSIIVTYLGKWLGRLTMFLLSIDYTVRGWENLPDEPVVFIINHSSTLDIPVVLGMGLRDVRFMAKKEFRYNPFVSIIALVTGQIFIDRGNSEKAIATIQRAYERLRKHRLHILVAPEGSRSHKELVAPFKKGAFRIAMDLDRPIVPIVLKGVRDIAPGKSINFNPGKVTVTIKPPIKLNEQSPLEDQIELTRSKYLTWLTES